ncbi:MULTISPECIES: sugar phosphate isomerase/epimerase [unclassified Microbacterium]|uniref:sugar phosphate isomerase/epimerase family protein n=1 Tax=unclassified Microbacterium TaxID=2609290 RepID=UPI000EA91775|nr:MULTISPECIES: sugar phosphate isomerase/epimerase [unclassified Microbacterium]MBT2486563.1 sugar phosphate isomerase/epimerase [Microbacterium sp. ISL-108]RKN69252.1 sugar phosphate isomerase/epimerase [Microbacterium sp. CGR2]
MVRIALDPTPYHHDHALLDFPEVAARLGYEHLHLTPHGDFAPFFRYPKADDALVGALKKRAADAGVSIPALLPVQRISSPDEVQRVAAVRNMRRIIELAVALDVPVLNTEFSGRPERQEDSEAAFYRSMEELLPILEKEGVRMNIDPHPDDFVEDGLEAWRVIRGLNSSAVGFVYVGSHTFHYGDRATTLLPEIGDRLGAVYAADTFDHNRSHGLRYISNPPGNAARVHQHLRIGDGDVDWTQLFDTLRATGYFDRADALIVSNVFAEDEHADEVSRFQLQKLRELIG